MPHARLLSICACILVLTTSSLAAAERVVQYRGDRNGFYEGAKPSALEWDVPTGKNIRWTALTPNWGYGHPLVVGNQVIVVDEPGWEHDFPVITSYDLKTGKQNWLTEINHLPVLGISQDEQDQVAKVLNELWANFRKAYTHSYEGYLVKGGKKSRSEAETAEIWAWLTDIDPEKWKLTGSEKKDPRKKKKFSIFFEGGQRKGHGGLRSWNFNWVGLAKYPEMQKKETFPVKYGLATECFYGFNAAREGVAAPAPFRTVSTSTGVASGAAGSASIWMAASNGWCGRSTPRKVEPLGTAITIPSFAAPSSGTAC